MLNQSEKQDRYTICKFSDLEKAFIAKNPDGKITKESGYVRVQFSKTSNSYRYYGRVGEIATKLNISLSEHDYTEKPKIDTKRFDGVIKISSEFFCMSKPEPFIELKCFITEGQIFIDWYNGDCRLKLYESKIGKYFVFSGKRVYFNQVSDCRLEQVA